MDKLDLLLLSFVYFLRMTLLFILPARRFYDYWFHSCDNTQLRHDLWTWLRFLFGATICLGLYAAHAVLKLVVTFVQLLPFWGVLSFWPRFYWHILSSSSPQDRPPVSRFTRRRFIAKGKVRMQPTLYRLRVLSSYQVWGAFAYLGANSARNAGVAIAASTGKIYSDDPARISVVYDYFAEIAGEPPDNAFLWILACIAIVAIHAALVTYGTWRIWWHQRNQPTTTPTKHHISLASSGDKGSVDFGQYFDTDGIPFVIDNSATCII